jgi:hypothetical protein
MVGVINPNSTQTLASQIEAAKNADFMVAPGDKIPSEASSTLHVPSATAQPPTAPASDHHHTLSGGAIAGIVVGGVAFLVICAALFFFIGRTKSLKEILARKDAIVNNTSTPGVDSGAAGTPAFTASSYSPYHSQAEYGNLPMYGQHQVSDPHPAGWASPPRHPERMSPTPQTP